MTEINVIRELGSTTRKINEIRGRPLSYRNQTIDLLCKSVGWFLYDRGLCHERVKCFAEKGALKNFAKLQETAAVVSLFIKETPTEVFL